jgi:hypothetical protein
MVRLVWGSFERIDSRRLVFEHENNRLMNYDHIMTDIAILNQPR